MCGHGDGAAFPRATNASLSFCGYNGTSCCNATDDAAVQKQFAAMNISGTPCGDVVKNVLCAVRTAGLLFSDGFFEGVLCRPLRFPARTYRDAARTPASCSP